MQRPKFDPDLNHQPISLYKEIYEPSEDTFAMCDALMKDYEYIKQIVENHLQNQQRESIQMNILEMGPGSGYCISYLKNMLNHIMREIQEGKNHTNINTNMNTNMNTNINSNMNTSIDSNLNLDTNNHTIDIKSNKSNSNNMNESSMHVNNTFYKTFCIDINQKALDTTKETFLKNNIFYEGDEFIHGNLFDKFLNSSKELNQLVHPFDIIIFNPPYVQSEDVEVQIENSIQSVYAGGERGRVVIDMFLNQLPLFLRGVCYLLLEQVNDIEEVQKIILSLNLRSRCIHQKKADGEYHYVFRIWRHKSI